jgi:transglutaminase/protease-like cytokinesis protein 3
MSKAKFLFITIVLIVVGLFININAYASTATGTTDTKVNIDKDAFKKGILKVGYVSESKKIVKIIVEKNDQRYIYKLRNDGVQECYALQMGNGEYKATVYENIEGENYIPVYSEKIDLELTDDSVIYLNSIQNINWNTNMTTIKKATALISNAKNEKQRLKAIYGFVVPYLKYDYDKYHNINKLSNPYIPEIDKTYVERKGICYDYSAFFAGMLRSAGIPTKIIMGYSKYVKEYHAWNEVYIAATGKWMVIDTTYDSCIYASKNKYTMEKEKDAYSTIKSY